MVDDLSRSECKSQCKVLICPNSFVPQCKVVDVTESDGRTVLRCRLTGTATKTGKSVDFTAINILTSNEDGTQAEGDWYGDLTYVLMEGGDYDPVAIAAAAAAE